MLLSDCCGKSANAELLSRGVKQTFTQIYAKLLMIIIPNVHVIKLLGTMGRIISEEINSGKWENNGLGLISEKL